MFKWLTFLLLLAIPTTELLFNTVGGQGASRQEKEIIISETYLKAFAGDEAKIEDDLHKREVIINKDIQNYLRDVDIFFRNVEFEFDIQDIEQLTNASGQTYFKARVLRTLNGTTFNTEAVKNQL